MHEGGQSSLSGCVRGIMGPSGGYRAVWTWGLLPLRDALHVRLGSQKPHGATLVFWGAPSLLRTTPLIQQCYSKLGFPPILS